LEINALKQKIEGLNARSEKLNTARNQDIGRKNALQAQSEDLLKEYNRKYGTNLDISGIEAEILKVVSEKEKVAAGLEALFKAVDEGDYARANELAGVIYRDLEGCMNALWLFIFRGKRIPKLYSDLNY
jgi:hypothetical protein